MYFCFVLIIIHNQTKWIQPNSNLLLVHNSVFIHRFKSSSENVTVSSAFFLKLLYLLPTSPFFAFRILFLFQPHPHHVFSFFIYYYYYLYSDGRFGFWVGSRTRYEMWLKAILRWFWILTISKLDWEKSDKEKENKTFL